MRCVRACLTAIALLMVPCQSANADVQADCVAIAAKISNTNGADVDAWLARYRQAYVSCRAQADVVTPGAEKTATKSVNKKAVFKSSKVKPVPTLANPSPEVSKIEKTPPKPIQKPRKLARSKTKKKVETLRARAPVKSPVPAGKLIRAPKATMRIGPESWRINCSARFGGFSKNSEWYISSSG